VVCDDVTGLDIQGLHAQAGPEGDALLRLVNVRDAIVRGCLAPKNIKVFLQAAGPQTRAIHLAGNALDAAEKAVVCGEGADPKAVTTEGGPSH
jgi:hypothetical protein